MFKFARFIFFCLAFCLFFAVGCDEFSKMRVEDFGERKVVVLESVLSDSFLKLEFSDGRNLSAVYWRKDVDHAYLFDIFSNKLFVEANGVFNTNPDFFRSLKRDVDWEKVKDAVTHKVVDEFCGVIDRIRGGAEKISGFSSATLVASLNDIKKRLRELGLNRWRAAVEAEKNKIHALGLEYCVTKEQADRMFLGIDFSASYASILKNRLTGPLLVCLGEESHNEDSNKKEAARLLEEAKALGFNYFLVEHVLSDDQKLLDNYQLDGEGSEKAVLEYLPRNLWSKSYFKVIEKAKKLGFKLVAIGAKQRDDIEFLRGYYYLAMNAAKVFKEDPLAKAVCFTGATHVFQNYILESGVVFEGYLMRQDIPHVVKNLTGVRAVSFECIGMPAADYQNPEKVLKTHIENRGWADKRFFIHVPPEISTLSPEGEYYYIHLPQRSGK